MLSAGVVRPVRINTNVAAENAYRLSSMNNKALEKSIQKISSSLRINKAGDDAAGLAISEKLRGQIRGLGQVERNIQDGISMIQTAEAGMQEIHSLLQRGREISVQAGNDTLVESDKNSLQQEINQIIQEIDRIAETTNFNTINLLNCPTITPDRSQ
jgi:flagellin